MQNYVFEKKRGSAAVSWLSQLIAGLSDGKKYEITVKEKKNRRSLQANAYAWELIDKLAEKTRISKEEIYRHMIRQIGGVSTTVTCYNIAVKKLIEKWTDKGLGWQADVFQAGDSGKSDVILYYGSSSYDTAQMSRLIDLIVQECEQQGIETIPPNELASMLEAWKP